MDKWFFAGSQDAETYTGPFATREEAITEAEACYRIDGYEGCWIGQGRSPSVRLCDPDYYLEQSFEDHEDWGFDAACVSLETLLQCPYAVMQDLRDSFQPVFEAWMDRHGLQPHHYVVEHTEYVPFAKERSNA